MRKKGELTSVLVVSIVVLLSTGVLFAGAGQIFPFLNDAMQDAFCTISASVRLGGGFFQFGKNPGTLLCKRHDLSFDQTDISNGVALTKIEERIRTCWGNMLKGKAGQFNKETAWMGNNPCLICATIEFQDVKSQHLENLPQKLKLTSTFDVSTWDYIYSENFPAKFGNIQSPVVSFVDGEWKEAKIQTDQKYAMVYRVYNPAFFADLKLIFDKEIPATIPIVSGNDLKNLECSYIYN